MTNEKAKERLEIILKQYNDGLITEKEKNCAVFTILYEVLYG